MTAIDSAAAERQVGIIEDALSSAADCSGGYDHGADEALTALDRISSAVFAHPDAVYLASDTCAGCRRLTALEYPSCGRGECTSFRFRRMAGV